LPLPYPRLHGFARLLSRSHWLDASVALKWRVLLSQLVQDCGVNFEIRHCIPFGRSLTPLENFLYALIHCYFTYSSNGGELPNLSTPCARRITVAEAALQTWLGVLHECSVPLDWYGEKEAEGVSGALKSLNATRELAYCILFESSTDRKCGIGESGGQSRPTLLPATFGVW